MSNATIARGGTSVDLPLLTGQGGTPLIIRDVGKPHLTLNGTGVLDPFHQDQWSGLEQYNLTGRFVDANAYTDAITLIDLVKSNNDGTETTLDLPTSEFDSSINVAPAAGVEEALTVTYNPGRRNSVDVQAAFTRIRETIGSGTQDASSPTTSGSGPIQLTDGSVTVDFTQDVVVTRSVGRPKSVIRRTPFQYPNYIDKIKTAYDAFEINFQLTQNTVSTVQDLVSMFNTALGRDSLTLDFNGLYGYGEFSVVPFGSDALRHHRPSGEQGTTVIPSVNLRVVQ